MTIYNQRGAIRGIDNNIFTEVGIEYQRQCEKYNRSDDLTGSRSNSKNTKLPAVRNRNNNPYRNKTPAMR